MGTSSVLTDLGILGGKAPTPTGVHVSNIWLLHCGLSNLDLDPHASNVVETTCFHFFFCPAHLDRAGAGLGS